MLTFGKTVETKKKKEFYDAKKKIIKNKNKNKN